MEGSIPGEDDIADCGYPYLSQELLATCCGICIIRIRITFFFAIWYGVLSGTREPKLLEMMFPVAYLLFAVIFTIRSIRSAVSLSNTSIEVRGLSETKTLPLDKIEGRRRYVDHGDANTPSVRHLVLVPNDDRFSKIDIEENFQFDDFFRQWFDGLPDLDELDKHKPKASNFGLV